MKVSQTLEKEILNKYAELKVLNKTALYFNISSKTVKRILKKNNAYIPLIKIKKELHKCLNCDNTTKYKFCSRSCSAQFNNRKRVNQEKREQIDEKNKVSKFFKEKFPDSTGSELIKNIANYKILNEPWENLISYERKRKRIILEQNNKCNKCHLSEWLGQPLVLEIDHINGINDDHRRENMEAICPNCHSMTVTWKGRNRSDKFKKSQTISFEEIKSTYLESKNIRQTLIKLNLVPKGRNYHRIYKVLDSYGISYEKQSITNRKTKDCIKIV